MTHGAQTIEVRGATEHNLKSLDLTIERQAITVITGVSGSGKSSLAFDTILAESQRRFFYTLSHYSRQFLDLQARPAVRFISGLSPAIALAQNETQPSRRATVGTLTDISELLGVMFARFGEQLCPEHLLPTAAQPPQEIAKRLLAAYEGLQLAICAPIVEAKKGAFKAQLTGLATRGFAKAFVDSQMMSLSPVPVLAKDEKHTIKVVIDYVKMQPKSLPRLVRSLEVALQEGQGFGEYWLADTKGHIDLATGGIFSTKGGCPVCGYSWERLDSRHFSINSLGKCGRCSGLATLQYGAKNSDDCEIVADEDAEDANDLDERIAWRERCPACLGTGLDPRLEGIRLSGSSPRDLHAMSVKELLQKLHSLLQNEPLASNPAFQRVCDEAVSALKRIDDIGLSYLNIARRIRSLSGGEAQRLKLAGILAESLRGVLYILDEPSQGLHPSEVEAVWGALTRLRDSGNTVIIVDHDEFFIRKADYVIDLGPGGGTRGGRLLAKFRPSEAGRFAKQSITAQHLLRLETDGNLSAVAVARPLASSRLVITGATLHNLRIPRVEFPLGAMTVVTGVSGAGKSSLVLKTLYANLWTLIHRDKKQKQGYRYCETVEGWESLDTVELIDRRPVAKSSVSMPATYLDAFSELRDLYASLPEAQVLGLTARSFSLHADGVGAGRCPECKGRGEQSLKMRFLADARVRCPMCQGSRYRPVVLQVKYAGFSIAEVLELTLDEVTAHFKNHRKLVHKLSPAVELGLGYLKMGQPSASLSGGEAQRLKLVPYLAKRHGDRSLIILDEPTTGLHFEDVAKLLRVLQNLVMQGTTVIAIEHNSDVKAAADWIVELGPGAASAGGRLIYQGSRV